MLFIYQIIKKIQCEKSSYFAGMYKKPFSHLLHVIMEGYATYEGSFR